MNLSQKNSFLRNLFDTCDEPVFTLEEAIRQISLPMKENGLEKTFVEAEMDKFY